jgi:hypothetical protein
MALNHAIMMMAARKRMVQERQFLGHGGRKMGF